MSKLRVTDMLNDILFEQGITKESFVNEIKKVENIAGTDKFLGTNELVAGQLLHLGCDDTFDCENFIRSYVVNSDTASVNTETTNSLLRRILLRHYEQFVELLGVKNKLVASEESDKYHSRFLHNEQLDHIKTQRKLLSARESLKETQRHNKELEKKLSSELDYNISLIEENEKVKLDNDALKRTITICK